MVYILFYRRYVLVVFRKKKKKKLQYIILTCLGCRASTDSLELCTNGTSFFSFKFSFFFSSERLRVSRTNNSVLRINYLFYTVRVILVRTRRVCKKKTNFLLKIAPRRVHRVERDLRVGNPTFPRRTTFDERRFSGKACWTNKIGNGFSNSSNSSS